MPQHALSPRSLAASWSLALVLWPTTWLLAASCQGIGTVLAGGEWLGISLPLGAVPWALVNEPGIAFAASREALFAYWLPEIAVPALLVLAVPLLAPTRGGWVGELTVFHLTSAMAVLALGWAVPLGRLDGPAAGLARFWQVEPTVTSVVAASVGAVGAGGAVLRLGGQLWHVPGGPTRRRRLLLAFSHLGAPFLAWVVASVFLGWDVRLLPLLSACAVVAGGLTGAALFVPRTALRRPLPIRLGPLVAMGACGVCAALAFSWIGAAEKGRPRALLWSPQSATSNVRPEMLTYRLTPLPVRTGLPEPSASGS